jgi:hypothetical protein
MAGSGDQAEMLILLGDPALEMGFAGRPDLLPGAITFRPLRPVAGEQDTIGVLIYNAGREGATDVRVRFCVGHPDSGGEAIRDVTIPYLEAGDHTSGWMIWHPVSDAGTYQVSVQVDPQDEILESSEWNNVRWDSVRVCSPGDVQDVLPPTIELSVDEQTVGTQFRDFDYVSMTPVIEAVLADDESGIDTREIRVILNEVPVDDFELDCDEIGARVVNLRCPLGALKDGAYTIEVAVADCSCSPNLAEVGVTVIVETDFRIRNVGNYPNPWKGRTEFAYSLSKDARDVTIEIYSVGGRLIRSITHVSGHRNRNTVVWDGRDRSGIAVASGVYFYEIRAQSGSEHAKCTGKMLVVR